MKYEIYSKRNKNSIAFVLKKYFEIENGNSKFTQSSIIAESPDYSWVRNVKFLLENNVEITDEEMATKVLKLYEALEENEDVQNIYANFEISDEIMEKIDN